MGLNHAAVVEAFADFLDDSRHSVEQIRFVETVIDELTATGVIDPERLFESPYTDDLPQGPDHIFPSDDLRIIVDTLHELRAHAVPAESRPA